MDISIHPPREGWDALAAIINPPALNISIHPPREGWDDVGILFFRLAGDFNPPTPRGVGPGLVRPVPAERDFNPPTPRGVGRVPAVPDVGEVGFQSTHPARGGTGSAI